MGSVGNKSKLTIPDVQSTTDSTLSKADGKTVKVSAGTWTIKDENGKTAGMIRNIRSLKVESDNARQQFQIFSDLKKMGFTQSEIMDNIKNLFRYDGKYVYLMDMHHYNNKAKYGNFDENEQKRWEKDVDFLNKLKGKNIEVVKVGRRG